MVSCPRAGQYCFECGIIFFAPLLFVAKRIITLNVKGDNMKDMVFLGICGSLRRASRNMGLLRKAREVMPQGCSLEIADISGLPFYNADIEKPECVRDLVKKAEAADGYVLASPEYNYSLAPALKNALDWLSREPGLKPFSGKPGAIMGAGGGMGTCRSQNHLRQVCVYLNLLLIDKPEFFSNAFSPAFNEAGDVVDPEMEKKIAALMNALNDWALVLRKGKSGN